MKKILFIILITFSISMSSLYAQILRAGDGIRITFFNIEDAVKGDYFVQENNRIHLPYLGLINTLNKDFSEIRNEVINGYSNIYKNPEINIEPLYRISILGEVKQPGLYYLTGFEKLTDLIALAGGETSDSNLDGILLVREDANLKTDLSSFIKGKNTTADIGLISGDKIYVPRTWWVGARDASIIISGVAVLITMVSLFTK